jgi:hypothetical protein
MAERFFKIKAVILIGFAVYCLFILAIKTFFATIHQFSIFRKHLKPHVKFDWNDDEEAHFKLLQKQ